MPGACAMNPDSEMSNEDVEIVSQTALYDGFFKMNQYRLRHKLFKGEWSGEIVREMFERGHAVAVLPYDPIRQQFVLIEQFRLGAMATRDNPWLIEVVAGVIDKQESAEQVCIREAEEEADIEISDLVKAISYLSSPGGTTERIDVFVAKVDASEAGGVHGLDHEGEDIKVHVVDEHEAMNWLESGKIDNAASIIALQWFALNKQRVIDEWNRT